MAGGAFLAIAKVLCISGVFGTRIARGSSSNIVLVSLGNPNKFPSPVIWERYTKFSELVADSMQMSCRRTVTLCT